MTKTILIGIIVATFIAGIGTAYAGPIMPKITLAGDVFIDGALTVQDGTQGSGKVFTSDGAGTGSWQDNVADLSTLNTYRNRSDEVLIAPNTAGTASISCDPGDLITGGGFVTNNANNRASILLGSQQVSNVWGVTMRHDGSTLQAFGLFADVQCLDITP